MDKKQVLNLLSQLAASASSPEIAAARLGAAGHALQGFRIETAEVTT